MTKLKQLASQLPKGLNSDWEGTNHYELQDMCGNDFWWCMVGSGTEGLEPNPCETVEGKRLGLIMDIAEEVARMYHAGELQ